MQNTWQKTLHRFRRLRTALIRKALPRRTEEEALEFRIRRRIKELGRTYEDGNSDLVEFTYHPIPFAEFRDIKCHRKEAAARLKPISDRLQIKPGDWILDIGANVGFFAFSLERLGAFVEAYEVNSASFEIGAALSRLNKSNVLYLNKPFGTAAINYLRPHYKSVLLLSVFHWIVKQEGAERAAEVLRALAQRTETIFFEAPTSAEDGMFQHELFSSKEGIEKYLHAALPTATLTELIRDDGWGGRFLYCLDCRSLNQP
jgi:2-polyprenyl-3-methyl-5-hydroxy-6-metoxy-1,4-benzoquinol methylase